MPYLSNEELAELKLRVSAALGTGANIANANDHLLGLIKEVQEMRKMSEEVPTGLTLKEPKGFTLKVKEMTVESAPKVEEPAPEPAAKQEEEAPQMALEFPAPPAEMTPEPEAKQELAPEAPQENPPKGAEDAEKKAAEKKAAKAAAKAAKAANKGESE